MVRYSISSVSLSPPNFECATTRMRLRASLPWDFSALMCSLKERCESHHSPRNFADSSTGWMLQWSWLLEVSGLCVWVQWNVQLNIYGLQTWTHSLLHPQRWCPNNRLYSCGKYPQPKHCRSHLCTAPSEYWSLQPIVTGTTSEERRILVSNWERSCCPHQ